MEKVKSSGKKVCEWCGQLLSDRELKEGKVVCQEYEDHWNNN